MAGRLGGAMPNLPTGIAPGTQAGNGGNSQPPRGPPPGPAPSDPGDDDGHRARQPPQTPDSRRNRRRERSQDRGRGDEILERLLTALGQIRAPAQGTVVVNTVQMEKPIKYDGENYAESFPQDYHKINWIGSLMTGKARTWHDQRHHQVQRMNLTDNWASYSAALKTRFKDSAEKHRNAEKMKNLKYKGDTQQYLTELLDLNEVVRWSGTTFQNHITSVLPDEITRLVYSQQGSIPEDDDAFLVAIQEAGQIYENMLSNPGLSNQGKDMPASRKEHPRSGQSDKPNRSNPGPNQSSNASKKEKEKPERNPKKLWPSVSAALRGVDQAKIDERKKKQIACWRCGRDNHSALECFARKDKEGKELPAPPKVAGTKRKLEQEDAPEEQEDNKKTKIDAIHSRITPEERFEVIEDSDNESSF